MSDQRRIIYLEERVQELERLANCRWSNDPLTHVTMYLDSEKRLTCGCRVCIYEQAQMDAMRASLGLERESV